MKTFFIASLSDSSNLPRVCGLASELMSLGLDWEYNWIDALMNNTGNPEEFIQGAINADIFIFLQSPTTRVSIGAHVALGARIAVRKTAYILEDRFNTSYCFYQHERVIKYQSTQNLLNVIKFSINKKPIETASKRGWRHGLAGLTPTGSEPEYVREYIHARLLRGPE